MFEFRLKFHWRFFKGPIYNIPALVQIMAWRRPSDKPLSEPMMDSLSMHICVTRPQWVNSSPHPLPLPSAAYMHQWTGSAFVQVTACRRFGANPLPEPMLAFCQLDFWEQISVKFEWEFFHFNSRKCFWNYHLSKWQPFFPGGDEVNMIEFPNDIVQSIFSIHGSITDATANQWTYDICHIMSWHVYTLRLRQNGCHFTEDNFKCIFFNGNFWISYKISLKYVP